MANIDSVILTKFKQDIGYAPISSLYNRDEKFFRIIIDIGKQLTFSKSKFIIRTRFEGNEIECKVDDNECLTFCIYDGDKLLLKRENVSFSYKEVVNNLPEKYKIVALIYNRNYLWNNLVKTSTNLGMMYEKKLCQDFYFQSKTQKFPACRALFIGLSDVFENILSPPDSYGMTVDLSLISDKVVENFIKSIYMIEPDIDTVFEWCEMLFIYHKYNLPENLIKMKLISMLNKDTINDITNMPSSPIRDVIFRDIFVCQVIERIFKSNTDMILNLLKRKRINFEDGLEPESKKQKLEK